MVVNIILINSIAYTPLMSTQSLPLLSETITPKDYHRRAIVVVNDYWYRDYLNSLTSRCINVVVGDREVVA